MAQELKDYDIMDIEAMDDERLEKSSTGKIFVTRVYIKDEVDAVLAEKDAENRRLKRALWIARANRASAWQIHFSLSHNHSIKREFTINGASSPHEGMVTMRTARDWAMIWKNVERKCRAKAEQYK